MPKVRSMAISIRVIASTGVARTRIRLVAYIDQMNSGRRNQVIPGARISWIVTMKFKPVRIDEKPAMNTPVATAKTCELLERGRIRRVEGPARVHAAGQKRVDGKKAAADKQIPADEV